MKLFVCLTFLFFLFVCLLFLLAVFFCPSIFFLFVFCMTFFSFCLSDFFPFCLSFFVQLSIFLFFSFFSSFLFVLWSADVLLLLTLKNVQSCQLDAIISMEIIEDGELINSVLQKPSTLIGQLATVNICDWLTKVIRIYEHGISISLC